MITNITGEPFSDFKTYSEDVRNIHFLYKITTEQDQSSYNNIQWGEDVTNFAPGIVIGSDEQILNSQPDMCSRYWLHAYDHPIIAGLLNKAHVDIKYSHLWRCIGKPFAISPDQKVCCKELTTLECVELPYIGTYTRILFGFNCVLKVYNDVYFSNWVQDWRYGNARKNNLVKTILTHTNKIIDKELKTCAPWSNLARSALSAYWIIKATEIYNSNMSNEDTTKIEEYTAKASCFAAIAAKQMSVDFSMIRIAEEVMAAP